MNAMSRRKPLLITLAALVALVLVGTAGVVWTHHENASGKRVTAIFDNASPLSPGNKVQLHGVRIGTIENISLRQGKAHVELALDPGAPALHRDARAVIKPVSLLGERYIDLFAGSDSAPYMTGHRVIPASQTSAAVDLDQVLDTLDDPTSTGLASMVTALGEGINGRGANTAAALRALAPAMNRTSELGDILDQQNAILVKLIDYAHGNAKAFADNDGKTMDRVVSQARQALSTVAANRRSLSEALGELPGTLSRAQRTLANLGGVADATTPTLRDIRPITDNLDGITGELKRFANAADPALARLPKVLNRLNGMLDQARPVVDKLPAASRDLRSVSDSLRPLGDTLLRHKPGTPSQLENLMTGVANWSMATSGYDGLSHYFRALVVVTPEMLRNLAAGALPALGPNNRGPIPKNPNQDGRSDSPPPISKDPSNATGLSPKQEQSLVGQLLGGA